MDTISASRSDVVLKLEDGTKIPARLEHHDAALLGALFGKPVVVSGTARFRPSGQLLLVDAESISEARPQDKLFGEVPQSRRMGLVVERAAVESSGVSGFFGTWPGDESDGDLLDALAALG